MRYTTLGAVLAAMACTTVQGRRPRSLNAFSERDCSYSTINGSSTTCCTSPLGVETCANSDDSVPIRWGSYYWGLPYDILDCFDIDADGWLTRNEFVEMLLYFEVIDEYYEWTWGTPIVFVDLIQCFPTSLSRFFFWWCPNKT